jgi:alginate O-acetyltransferase complex protein AlgI
VLFNSIAFVIFAIIFYSLWPIARRRPSTRYLLLVVASFIFYGWWDWRFLFLIIASGLLDYFSALGMEKTPNFRKLFLGLSIFGNIGSLMVFKYSGFFAENIEALFSNFGMTVNLQSAFPSFILILPVGISFYTFQSMSYTIDVYKGHLKPTKNVLHFFSYLAMFPQLVAGPIIRAADLLPQLKEWKPVTEQQRWDGLRLIVHGYFKKMVIADGLAIYVASAFGDASPAETSLFWWVMVTAFAFQIYCDFSGYSDIARGIAKWMGYDFMVNFNHPYIATSLRDFWQRWHISLSTWFRDYVYIPLGGSRGSKFKSELNMWATMLISGFWHGAAWNFIIWGSIHAFGMTVERFTRWPKRIMSLPGGKVFASIILLTQVWVSWVFFRAESFDQAMYILGRMFSFSGSITDFHSDIGWANLLDIGMLVGIATVRELYFWLGLEKKQFMLGRPKIVFEVLALAAMIVLCIFLRGVGSQFIYFQF